MLKKIVYACLSNRLVSTVAYNLLMGVGATKQAYRVMYRSGSLPDELLIKLPGKIFSLKTMRMRGLGGRDQVARTVALGGWRSFETPLPELYANVIEKDFVVFDVGANTGYYSLLAGAVSETIRVHAFEPVPYIKGIIAHNISLNPPVPDQVRVNDQALAAEAGVQELYVPMGDHGLVETSASLNKGFRSSHSELLKVEVTTMDAYVEAQRLNRVDVIKIDVESMEHVVLLGAQKTLGVLRPLVFFEVLQDADLEAINRVISGLNYVSIHLGDGVIEVRESVSACAHNSNQLLWPGEQMAKLDSFADKCGYRVQAGQKK